MNVLLKTLSNGTNYPVILESNKEFEPQFPVIELNDDESFEHLMKYDDPAFKQIKNEYEHRLNKLYCHPSLADLLKTNEIDFAILNICEEVFKSQNRDKIYFDHTDVET